MTTCPCGRPDYDACCGRLHRGEAPAANAEQLMRSRYSAFALGDGAYLARSWASSTRPDDLRLGGDDRRWTRLEVLVTEDGGLLDATGVVEFRAHHERGGRAGVLHERSRFVREDGRWVYLGPES